MSSIVYVHQRNNLWQNKRRVMVMEVSLSSIMGCARVKCGLLQGGRVIICLTQDIRSTVYHEYVSIM